MKIAVGTSATVAGSRINILWLNAQLQLTHSRFMVVAAALALSTKPQKLYTCCIGTLGVKVMYVISVEDLIFSIQSKLNLRLNLKTLV